MNNAEPQFHSHYNKLVRVAPDRLVPPPDSLARPPGQLAAGGYKTSTISPIFHSTQVRIIGRKQC